MTFFRRTGLRQGRWTVYIPARRHKPHDPSERHGSITCARRQPSCLESAACIVNWPDLSRHAADHLCRSM